MLFFAEDEGPSLSSGPFDLLLPSGQVLLRSLSPVFIGYRVTLRENITKGLLILFITIIIHHLNIIEILVALEVCL